MSTRVYWRSLLALLAAALFAVFAATPALAYGKENYQLGFAGTGVAPGTGFGFGFWGWCAFGGGNSFDSSGLATSGTTGDCNYAFYMHAPSGRVTCQQSVEVTAWKIQPSFPFADFFVTGTATNHPASAAICFGLFEGVFPSSFTNFDTLLPAAPGHYNLSGFLGGLTGELQVQVTAIP